MKKLSRLVAIAVLSASFALPSLVSAQFEYTCDPPCAQGMFCDVGGRCVSNSVLTQQPTSGGININYIKPYSDSIIGIINSILVPVLIAIAFIVFLWGIYKYFIWGAANESEKAEGRKFAMWGIIGLVVIFSVWALVNILMGALNLSGGRPPPIPKI